MKYDEDFARLIRWLRENGLEAHTSLSGKTIFVPRRRLPYRRPVDKMDDE